MEAGKAVLVRRDTGEKISVGIDEIADKLETVLTEIQANLYQRALAFRKENTFRIDNYGDFVKLFEGEGGFVETHWCGSAECEARIKEETKATIRVLPFGAEKIPGKCIKCGGEANQLALFAKNY